MSLSMIFFFFFQAEDGIRDATVTGVQTCALPISATVFNGASAADAEAALFKAMGGTPKEIANAQSAEWIRINNITHRGKTLATGGNATPSNSAADPTCATSSM